MSSTPAIKLRDHSGTSPVGLDGLRSAIAAIGSAAALAEAFAITPQALSQWTRVPADRVLAVEEITGISRTRLRPELYPADVCTIDGTAIRRAREERGWSQAELAKRAGTYQQTVNRIERGASQFSRAVPAVRAALGLPNPDDLDTHSSPRDRLAAAVAEVRAAASAINPALTEWTLTENLDGGFILAGSARR